jgi:hypothetical protein
MFLLGHLGIGSTLVRPFARRLSKKAIFLGAIFPDLLDKFLYYGLSVATGNWGDQLGLVRGTRTFGHTLILFFVVVVLGRIRQSRVWQAFALGFASHLILDVISNAFLSSSIWTSLFSAQFWSPFFWPASGWLFPLTPYHSMHEHVSMWQRPFIYYCEMLGFALLAWEMFRSIRKGKAHGV